MSVFKKMKSAAENAGLLPMTVADAQKAADERRAVMVQAQRAVEAAEEALNRGYDESRIRDLPALEATLASAKLDADRAQRAYQSAEKRLAERKAAAQEAGKAEAIVKRDLALERRTQAAARIDELAALIAEQRRAYDDQNEPLVLAAVAGVASRVPYINGESVLRAALVKSGAVASQYSRNLEAAQSGLDVAKRARGAVLADQSST